jgi:hypothetical protein
LPAFFQAGVSGVLFCQTIEGLADVPDALFFRMKIDEEAQDASAARGAAGESVDVQEIVALVQGQLAAFFFEGAEAGVVHLQAGGVGGEKGADERAGARGEFTEDGAEAVARFAVAGPAAQNAGGGTEGDVFVHGGIAAALGYQKIAIGGGEIDGRRGEEKDLAGF